MPREDGGGDGNEAAASQGTLTTARRWDTGLEDSPSEPIIGADLLTP